MNKQSKIFIAGHTGMVGSAIERKMRANGFNNLILKTSKELDLRNQQQVVSFFKTEQPEYVFLAAAKVGGIQAVNLARAEFLYDNLIIESNVIHAAYQFHVKKLLFLGSSCIYPRLSPQPIKEEYLLTGLLEPTNEPYSIAKIAGIKLCDAYRYQYNCNFISAMPCNLYGTNDNYDLQTSHVIPAMLCKFYEAVSQKKSSVFLWGDGTAMREFLYADDLADACIFLMQHYSNFGHINVGSGVDIQMKDLAQLIKNISGYTGKIIWQTEMPNGTPRKLMDVSKINQLGWKASTLLAEGLQKTYTEKFLTE